MFSVSKLTQKDLSSRSLAELWTAITEYYSVDEDAYLEQLLALAEGSKQETQQIEHSATDFIQRVRAKDNNAHGVDALLQEYSLDTQEGILLMCLAEALIRIPDSETADALIKDKLGAAEWDRHLGKSESALVNASTWGLLLTGKVVRMDANTQGGASNLLKRLVNRVGEPVIRKALHQAMKIMSKQFVLGSRIKEALKQAHKSVEQAYTYSFDMLGEAAITAKDADQYFKNYVQAIEAVAQHNVKTTAGTQRFTVSIKLSALHPRYEQAQQQRILTELYQQVLKLLELARLHNVGITLDAEEADRLELSLELFEKLYRAEVNQGWGQLGLAVQAYSKRALPTLVWLTKLSMQVGIEIPVRLVKGAYWDSEIKLCQQRGIESYPVFTRKEATDVSYLACARFLLSEAVQGKIYPQFASHNAHTVASILTFAKHQKGRFELQRLHGMGEALYAEVLAVHEVPARIYAPVGPYQELLPYLVRRLLENGANSSFVHRLVDAKTPIESLIAHPAQVLRQYSTLGNRNIVLPTAIFPGRVNSQGLNLNVAAHRQPLLEALGGYDTHLWQAGCLINGIKATCDETIDTKAIRVVSPHRRSEPVGNLYWANAEQVEQALTVAERGFCHWRSRPVRERSAILDSIADLYEQHRVELMALCRREAGKTLQDSLDEIREAVDFCRYYAQQARNAWEQPMALPGPTGESNSLQCLGRGVFLCISPWNFPLAIFTGQVAAALVSGNAVIAKPAEQTSLIAYRAVSLMLTAGIPNDVLQLVLGKGENLGPKLITDRRIAGVAFTGSTQTARLINRALAEREGPIVPLIAETGGQNAMLVDSTALPEQVVKDVMQSAFAAAGQRCSALRVLFVQTDIADRIIELLKGAMQELHVGDPADYATDVGPVIDENAQDQLLLHIERMQQEATLIAQAPMGVATQAGFFVQPTLFEIQSVQQLKQEHFGPILHLIRYPSDHLKSVIEDINGLGYGLTLGIHSRNEATAQYIADQIAVGNVYVNRNQIGAVVGAQPFGGQGLSGTGPKAGGPHYLYRFVTEKTISINTTAVGGNATLLSLGADTPRPIGEGS